MSRLAQQDNLTAYNAPGNASTKPLRTLLQLLINESLNTGDAGVNRINNVLEINPGHLKLVGGATNWEIKVADSKLVIQQGNTEFSFGSDGSLRIGSNPIISAGGHLHFDGYVITPDASERSEKKGSVSANSDWENVFEFPAEGFGKFRLEAWSVGEGGEEEKFCTNFSAVVVYGPQGCRIRNGRNKFLDGFIGFFSRLFSSKIEEEESTLIRDRGTERLGEEYPWSPTQNRIYARVIRQGNTRQLQLRAFMQNRPPNDNLHYYIERLWKEDPPPAPAAGQVDAANPVQGTPPPADNAPDHA